ncbi:MAG: cytochrome c family protein [Bosea sp.]|uniref:c-type cytochrome n=1 Tax=unclassified Bosea (in: a-proteobacteria) TaxID=2653178 RepID=UPI0009684BF3|nr:MULTISPECIES: cytochrome c family protein [unclassified Bosea (in: a-proteobacteria)]MBN9457385.1 cytochrome c family protein [Bosea sp. (in: a-proteobacteria)]OJV09631.1 MAG: cytochrome c family protein [Bosea sp. 67-29]
MKILIPALFLSSLLAVSSAAAQDVSVGERSFNKCRACHQIGETARNGVGPELNGLFGRHTGSVEGYAYSAANKAANLTWDEKTFAEYIRDPKAKIPGTKMVFVGIKNDKEIADLTAFLKQFGKDGKKM